jgi:predicted nucleotidyltransferase
MLFNEWKIFRGWLVLDYFLKGGSRIYLKKLARELKISPRTAEYYLKFYEREGVLEKEEIGNMVLYNLKSGPLSQGLKRIYAVAELQPVADQLAKGNPQIASVVLYGSYAKGEFDMESDIDILIIAQPKSIAVDAFKDFEHKTGIQISAEVMTPGAWRELSNKKDNFYLALMKNHVVLWGANI